MTTTEEPAPPAALVPLLLPLPTLAPDARLASTVLFAVMVPVCLRYPSSSSNSNSWSRRLYCTNRFIWCNGSWLSPDPGARLASTVAFALTGIGSGPSHQSQIRRIFTYVPPRFLVPLLRTSQRSLTLQTGQWHALWPEICREIFRTNREVILVEIKGLRIRTQKSRFWLSKHVLTKSSRNKKKIHPKCRTLK